MPKKIYDTEKILYLYKKYGTIQSVQMRLGYAPATIKKLLLENGVELKKHIPVRWDIKQNLKNKNTRETKI